MPLIAALGLVQAETVGAKLMLLERLLKDSAPVLRAETDGDATARSLLAQVRAEASAGRALLESDPMQASVHVENGLRLLNRLARAAPGDPAPGERERSYATLRDRVLSFRRSLVSIFTESPPSYEDAQSLERLERVLEDAGSLADQGRHDEATQQLQHAADAVEGALIRLRHRQTLVHELDLSTPERAYEYEVQRNQSMLLMLRLVADGREGFEAMIGPLRERNDGRLSEAETLMQRGEHARAVQELEQASAALERALRAYGLPIP